MDVSNRLRRVEVCQVRRMEEKVMQVKMEQVEEVMFGPRDDRPMLWPHNDALVVTVAIARAWVSRTFVDTGSSVNIMYYNYLRELNMRAQLQPPIWSFFGFSGEILVPIGTISLLSPREVPRLELKE